MPFNIKKPRKTNPLENLFDDSMFTPPIPEPINLDEVEEERAAEISSIDVIRNEFMEIKKKHSDSIEDMRTNPGLFQRAAQFWGKVPLWGKILGFLVFPAVVAVAIYFNIIALAVGVGLAGIMYCVASYLLTDDYETSLGHMENIKKGTEALNDYLEERVIRTEMNNQEYEAQLKAMSTANIAYEEAVKDAKRTVEELGINAQVDRENIARLNKTVNKLENNNAAFKETLDENKRELENLIATMTANEKIYGEQSQELDRPIARLKEIVALKERQYQEADNQIKALMELTSQLTGFNAEYREDMQGRVLDLQDAAQQVSQSAKQLAEEGDHMRKMNQLYDAQLDILQNTTQNDRLWVDQQRFIGKPANVSTNNNKAPEYEYTASMH